MMSPSSRRIFLQYCMAVGLPMMAGKTASADLNGYVHRPDTVYAWKVVSRDNVAQGTIYRLHLTSQTWQGIVWEHDLSVYQPSDIKPQRTMAMYNTGGGANPGNDFFGMELAKRSGIPVAILYHIPNQPLFGGKTEDALIAETFIRYLKTGDDTWPLLFPMVKSVVRAMDALQEFAKAEWKSEVPQFIITGASKRGWTTWLTAATGDKRVKAIAPMVIDTLNMPAQTPHQREYYGALSVQIKDYTDAGLTDISATPEGKKLIQLVDPYAYRKKLTLPKLILLGANDPYWTADSLRLYWDELPGEKWACYVPNAGHDLEEKTAGQSPNRERAVGVLAAFIRSQSGGPTLPKLAFSEPGGTPDKSYRLEIKVDQKPEAARLWVARAAIRDFRPATWTPQSLPPQQNLTFTLPHPSGEHVACFAELAFGQGDQTYTLCTPCRVLSP